MKNFGAPPQHSTPNGRGGKQTARNPPQKPQLVVSEQKVSQREKENSKRNTHTKTCGGCGVVPAWGGRFDRWSRWARQMYSQTSIGWVRGEMHEHCAEGQKDVERGVGFILSEMFANIWNRLPHTFCCLWLNFKEWLGRWEARLSSSARNWANSVAEIEISDLLGAKLTEGRSRLVISPNWDIPIASGFAWPMANILKSYLRRQSFLTVRRHLWCATNINVKLPSSRGGIQHEPAWEETQPRRKVSAMTLIHKSKRGFSNFVTLSEGSAGRPRRPIKTEDAGRQTLGSQRPFPGIWKPWE
ncbi:hypothetical protein B0H11DRAFT_1901474 [Mycena galericulata]|nr:hypothetical protein B0H11DRAFT_1901474 [Mycena galericulata]